MVRSFQACFGFLLLWMLFLPTPSHSQTEGDSTSSAPSHAAAPATPESPKIEPNWLYWVKGDELVKIEMTPVEVGASVDGGGVAAAALGFGGAKTWMILPGSTSELKIEDPQPKFRLAAERQIAMGIRLALFEARKDTRRARTETSKILDFFKPAVPLEMTKVIDGIYEFTPKKALAPGEYGITSSMTGPVADFTIVGETDTKRKK